MSTKVIVSNKSAMEALYGDKFGDVTAALKKLTASDEKKGLKTQVVYLDDAEAMKKLNAPPVTDPAAQNQNKKAVDGVFKALTPDYLLLLGAPDIIPHQHLKNPVRGDDDPDVPSDLPYASDNTYSRTIKRFINPTRVVGRLPGIMGVKDPAALVKAIETASALEIRPRNMYSKYFGVSAQVWEGSTTQSVTNIFGNDDVLNLSPPTGPDWTVEQLNGRAHFVNCHGGDHNPNWYGQKGYEYPIAVKAPEIVGKLLPGTIATAECCYGGQLYDPSGVGGQAGVCNTYLTNEACAFCGSTTIAYGPANGQGQADLITQYFLINLLNGSSAGRAMLEARQKYIQESGTMDPVSQKTIAQFILLGDPSGHPVFHFQPIIDKILSYVPKELLAAFQRSERRQKLVAVGKSLPSSVAVANLAPKEAPKGNALKVIETILKDIGLLDTVMDTFQVVGGAMFKKAMAAPGAKELIHLIHGKQLVKNSPVPDSTILMVKERDGQVISAQTVHRK
ncbi:MAG: hypothetical protein GY950_22635 [bacterium]|nr:hypothetical protein [bacterium]